MVYMFSQNAATTPSTPGRLAPNRGRRREQLNPSQAFMPLRPAGWGTQLNHAALAITAAILFAPQIALDPTAIVALAAGAYFTSGAAARIFHRHNNPSRLRHWARKHHGLQITTSDAIALLGGGATATHSAALHGDHLHLTQQHAAGASALNLKAMQ